MPDKKPAIYLNSLSIDTLDTTCGVFIGVNRAVGWSSHSKSNSGLGTSGDNCQNNLNIVYDNDIIDTPMEKSDMFLNTEGSADTGSLDIKFDNIDVNVLDTQSLIAVGNNSQSAWDSHSKSNGGLGYLYGTASVASNVNTVQDNDIIDTPINDQDIKPVFIRRGCD
ncbi:MAG: hypothetical protein M0Z41_01200 [Peptococcaceae bacterium]|jgi:hypothetical protein|nr:hypothetical protein [Peptococcaceae bacterium]